ncbi:polyketide cyclase [Chlorella sorokiniana]|uniref:Polyketide cyclase n=1 Tax=Chlorella sorokiniana TaxID=3076 RepID=A0A2P6TI40_CHLSO|nr:polyketide cyclase [Chlorella sorokiniana]|eukprot:PRW33963.1 polyketide cyclase [Chlorella sorokiniana]
MFDRTVETTVDILAPPEVVWAVLIDNAAWPEWNPTLVKCEGQLEPGQRLAVTAHMPGRSAWTFKPTVLTVEPNSELAWRGSLPIPGLFAGRHYFRLETEGASACRLVHGEQFSGLLPLLMGGLLSDTEKGFHAMNAALKARAEARAGVAQE